MAELTFFQFPDAALAALSVEAPKAYAALTGALAPTGVQLSVDGTTRVLSIENGRHRLYESGDAPVSLTTGRAVLTDLLEARRTLLDAVLDDGLALRGAPDHVAALHDALVAFFAGAVRSRSLPALLREYLTPGSEPYTTEGYDRNRDRVTS